MAEETQPKRIVKSFRLTPAEEARIPKLMEIANELGHDVNGHKIETFQDYIIFALNCAYTRLKDEYEMWKGRR